MVVQSGEQIVESRGLRACYYISNFEIRKPGAVGGLRGGGPERGIGYFFEAEVENT